MVETKSPPRRAAANPRAPDMLRAHTVGTIPPTKRAYRGFNRPASVRRARTIGRKSPSSAIPPTSPPGDANPFEANPPIPAAP